MTRVLRLFLTTLLGLGAGLAAVVAGATPAHACSCATFTDEQARVEADAVFTARLASRKDLDPGSGNVSSADPATLTFAVDRVFKGAVAARQPILTPRSGASCGWELAGAGPFLVFASVRGGVLWTGLCDGNREGAAPAAWGAGTAPAAGEAGPELPSSAGPLGSLGIAAGLVAAAIAAVLLLARRLRR